MTKRQIPTLVVFTTLTLATFNAPSARGDLTVQGYNANSHDRFVNDSSFIGNPHDWSGVSSGFYAGPGDATNGIRGPWATMISPTHFLSARHRRPGTNAEMTFFHSNDAAGGSETVTVAGGQAVGGDLWLGRLTSAVSADVAIYSILNPALALGAEINVVGLSSLTDSAVNQRMGRNVIDRVEYDYDTGIGVGHIFTYDYDNPGGLGADESRLAGWDSGGPSFSIYDGAPALVGIHWFIYSDEEVGDFGDSLIGSGDSFVSGYIDEINTELAMFGESLSISGVPEPSSLLLAGLLFGPAVTIRRRRRA